MVACKNSLNFGDVHDGTATKCSDSVQIIARMATAYSVEGQLEGVSSAMSFSNTKHYLA